MTSVWALLAMVAPEFGEWATYFSAGAAKRATAEAGIPRAVSPREADDMTRSVDTFISIVELALGVRHATLVDELVA
jgi:hypothetical protein